MRLNLPLQTVIDRRDPYDPILLELGSVKGEQGKKTVVMGLADGGYGPDPGDTAAALHLDSRGWHCPPGSPCTWIGLV